MTYLSEAASLCQIPSVFLILSLPEMHLLSHLPWFLVTSFFPWKLWKYKLLYQKAFPNKRLFSLIFNTASAFLPLNHVRLLSHLCSAWSGLSYIIHYILLTKRQYFFIFVLLSFFFFLLSDKTKQSFKLLMPCLVSERLNNCVYTLTYKFQVRLYMTKLIQWFTKY